MEQKPKPSHYDPNSERVKQWELELKERIKKRKAALSAMQCK